MAGKVTQISTRIVLDDEWSWGDFWEGFRRPFELAGFVRVKARRDSMRPIESEVSYQSDESTRRPQQGRERTRGRQQSSIVRERGRQLGRLEKAERLLREKRTDRKKSGKDSLPVSGAAGFLAREPAYRVEIHKGGLIRSRDARKAAEEVARAAEEEATRREATKDSVGQEAREKAEGDQGRYVGIPRPSNGLTTTPP